MRRPTVFISYSWGTLAHQDWVLRLANDLIKRYGINVLLDKYELQAGHELTYFMESAIEQADKVLLILTPGYKASAGQREGGVGYESSLISQGIYAAQVNEHKFIPVLREGTADTSCPAFVQPLLYHDMRKDSNYEIDLEKLVRRVVDAPELQKPDLGPLVDFSKSAPDPLLREMQQLTAQNRLNEDLERLLNSREGVEMAAREVLRLHQLVEQRAKQYSDNTDFKFRSETRAGSELGLYGGGNSVLMYWQTSVSNSTRDAELLVTHLVGRASLQGGSFTFSPTPPQRREQIGWHFALSPTEEPRWKAGQEVITTEEVVQRAFSFLLNQIKQQQKAAARRS